jgi:hypothetical protein
VTSDTGADTPGAGPSDESARQHAEEVAARAARRNDDPETRREAMEQELDSEGLSDEGEHLGQHID